MIKTGIYAFTNKANGKKYIGQSINIYDRYSQHKHRYNNPTDSGYNGAIHFAFRKYGWDAFTFEILEECEITELDEKEQYYIKKYNTIAPTGYNLTLGGQQKVAGAQNVCPFCQKTKDASASSCLDCYRAKLQQECILPNSQISIELVDEILKTSFEATAKSHGYLSGNSIKKKLVAMKIPSTKAALFKYYEKQTGHLHSKIIEQNEKEKTRLENKLKNSPKPVDQYDLLGNFIQTFPSATEAGKRCNLHSGHISDVIHGKRKKAGNFVWRRHTEP